MRHNKKFNHLSRTASHRSAMLSNMACSLIKHKRITTTLAKAKALKKYVEPLITKSKDDTMNSRRVVFSYLQDKVAVTELFREIRVKVLDRPGGYTRIIKTGFRASDASEMCFIELVDFDENMINILNASFLAMHRALDQLKVRPEAVIVDGNRFKPYKDLPYTTIVKGDGKYLSIAAASILAKTYRDDYMDELAE